MNVIEVEVTGLIKSSAYPLHLVQGVTVLRIHLNFAMELVDLSR